MTSAHNLDDPNLVPFPSLQNVISELGSHARRKIVPVAKVTNVQVDPVAREVVPHHQMPATHSTFPAEDSSCNSSNTAPTVLLVDDDDMVRRFIATALTRLGYEVHEATHGEEGLRKYNEHGKNIDVIVSDVLMPNLTGPEMIRKLQERGLDSTPVLFVTGYSDIYLSSHFNEDFPGARRLDKPFSVEDLSSNVHELLGEIDKLDS